MKQDGYQARYYSRRSFLRLGALGLAAGALVLACGDDEEDAGSGQNPQAPTPSVSGGNVDSPPELKLVSGWYRDRQVRYFDFGTNTRLSQGNSVAVAPIYAFVSGTDSQGNPRPVEGQANVIGVKPGDTGYSDLWQVNLVTVPDDFRANDIRSVAAVMSSGYEITPTNMFVNCPVVAKGTTLEGGKPLVQGWLNGDEVFYPDFGLNPPVAIPIWAFASGIDDQGRPEFVAGQNNIIDALPADPGYSAFWRVNLVMVPENYEVNTIRSAEAVQASGFVVQTTDMVVNCPVVS